MGIIRGALVVALSLVLFLSIIAAGTFLTFSKSLDHDVLKAEIANNLDKISGEVNFSDMLLQSYPEMQDYCSAHDSFDYEFGIAHYSVPCFEIIDGKNSVFNYILNTYSVDSVLIENLSLSLDENYITLENYCMDSKPFVYHDDESGFDLNISCSSIENGTIAIVNEAIGKLVDRVYYENYECGLFNCVSQEGMTKGALALVSEHAKDYWNGKFLLASLIAVVAFVLLFFFVETKSNSFIIAGVLLVLSSLIFIKLDVLFSWLSNKNFFWVLVILVSKSFEVFWNFFIIGIILGVFGISLKMFSWGQRIAGFFSKFSNKKEAVIKEVPVEKK